MLIGAGFITPPRAGLCKINHLEPQIYPKTISQIISILS